MSTDLIVRNFFIVIVIALVIAIVVVIDKSININKSKKTKQPKIISMHQSKKYKLFTIILLVLSLLLILIVGYMAYFIVKAGNQYQETVTELNKTKADLSSAGNTVQLYQKRINELNSQITSLQQQLNQKPTTVYVPQPTTPSYSPPPYTPPTIINCSPDLYGGFRCF